MPRTADSTSPICDMSAVNTSIVKTEVSRSPVPSPHDPHDGAEGTDSTEELNLKDPQFAQLQQIRAQQLEREKLARQQILLNEYHKQQMQLTEHYQKELQRMKIRSEMLEKQQAARAEDDKQRQFELDRLKKSTKEERPGNASSEVKQRLQDYLLKKKAAQQAAEGSSSITGSSTNALNYNRKKHPYMPSPHSHDEYSLRKTASEPNICLKDRLKHRVRGRSSPMATRKDRPIKRRGIHPCMDSCSTPDSEHSSPPNGAQVSRSSSGSTPISEEANPGPPSGYGPLESGHGAIAAQGSCSDLTLYSSPSLPNISLGRPPHSQQPEGMKLSILSETEGRGDEELDHPLTNHMIPSSVPYYPSIPVSLLENATRLSMAGQGAASISPIHPMLLAGAIPYHFTDVQNALQNRITSRTIQRPLGRTQSAPLPIGHPRLQGNPSAFLPVNMPPNLQFDPGTMSTTNIVKQHVRNTVLTRTSSKNHVENVEEETEAAVAQAIASDGPVNNGVSVVTHGQQMMDYTQNRGMGVIQNVETRGLLRTHLSTRELLAQRLNAAGSTPRSGSHIARPMARSQSSPLVTLSTGVQETQLMVNKKNATTGLAYDSLMQKHQCICGDNSQHPENGGRLQAVWSRLQDSGLIQACHRLRARKADLAEIQSCHSEAHVQLFGSNPLSRQPLNKLSMKGFFVRLQCGGIGVDSDTTWNESHTASAARMAVGCVVDLACKVATGELRNGFALVRPPGHHAEHQTAMGFCFFNSVAIAARQLQLKYSVDKILILDWDVHHGNGTQSMFYEDNHILYISLHRYDDGSFFPGTGAPQEVGEGDGYGFNVNISWSGSLNPPMGDAEYMAAFRTVVMPIAEDFNPDIVLVSAGFDGADGHPGPLGGYKVSAGCFAHMTQQLMTLARGKVVLALEGGYHISSVCDASEACIRTLLGEAPSPLPSRHDTPCKAAQETLHTVIAVQSNHWPVIRRHATLVSMTMAEAMDQQDTVCAMASLRVNNCVNLSRPSIPLGTETDLLLPHCGVPSQPTTVITQTSRPPPINESLRISSTVMRSEVVERISPKDEVEPMEEDPHGK